MIAVPKANQKTGTKNKPNQAKAKLVKQAQESRHVQRESAANTKRGLPVSSSCLIAVQPCLTSRLYPRRQAKERRRGELSALDRLFANARVRVPLTVDAVCSKAKAPTKSPAGKGKGKGKADKLSVVIVNKQAKYVSMASTARQM